MVFVDEEKVVKIAPHFLCRFQNGKQIELAAFGEGGKGLGQNAHLDFSRGWPNPLA